MSTCRGCWRDERVPHGPGMVLMIIGYEDGGADDPYVWHQHPGGCPGGDQPHRLSECPAFGDQLRAVTPSEELAPCPAMPEAWLQRTRAIRAGYYFDAVGQDDRAMTGCA